MQQIYTFETAGMPELAQVGGKGLSLIMMTQREMPVPPGFVLSLDFFAPWLATIRQTPQWASVVQAVDGVPETLKVSCEAVKALCANLTLDAERDAALTRAVEDLGGALFAVRSSSPEEDLEGASFAGGYETVLGVKRDGILSAVRRAFASCFDERVIVYKREHGFDVTQPRIAVVVQQQIAAETAGVAFSLNPINNCYDEAVINANFGLGESVVSGQVSPDTFVVDKVRRLILEKKIGKKETVIWLAEDGGTYARPAPNRAQACLSDAQILQLADLMMQVERAYDKPMDIEWAFASSPSSVERGTGDEIYLLQARPITTYVPLPDTLLTPPGAPKFLYQDMTLTKWGMPELLSVMGADYIAIGNVAILRMTMGDISPEVAAMLRPIGGGRAYVNVSLNLKMQRKKRVVAEYRTIDALSAEIVANLDETEYIPPRLPAVFKGMLFKIIRQNVGLMGQLLYALRHPDLSRQRYLDSVQQLPDDLAAIAHTATSIRELAERMEERLLRDTGLFLAVIFATEIARMRLHALFKRDAPTVQMRAAALEHALPHNVTIEMGLAMERLARFAEIGTRASGVDFTARLAARAFSPEFLLAWDDFMARYGFRGPMEMDPAVPRPYEQPAQFFERLRLMASADAAHSSQVTYGQVRAEREQAYAELLALIRQRGRRQARQFEKNYRILVELGGLREMPKYCAVLIADMFRRRLLQVAQPLVQARRLDDVQQVFDLTINDLDRGLADPTLDLRALAVENTRFLKKLAHVREFPRLIDSRGKILRAPRKAAAEGELIGEPISSGVARGPVKVLRTADEKPVLPGDILVTRATDPGWTPLFINAAGVVLEVGGLLQHGALVAREYGKPCVAGIEDVTTLLSDGQIVELDGANGIVRVV